MKQLIVLTAVLPLLLIFMVQYALDQKNSSVIGQFQDCVYTAKEQAKQAGYFTREIRENLRKSISDRTGIPPEEIVIEATDVPRYRVNGFDGAGTRELIHYKVSVPIHRLVAGHRLFGMTREENRGVYTIESHTASELLRGGPE